MRLHPPALALAGLASALGAAPSAHAPFIAVRLLAETAEPQPGGTMLIGFRMVPRPGWHGYWSNPGESGLAPTVRWSAPAGVHIGPLRHPAPSLMQVSGLVSYVHAGPHVLVAQVRLDRGLPLGKVLPITADLNWAACSDRLCVPEKARLSLRLRTGAGAPSPDAALLRRALAAEPRQHAPGSFETRGGQIVLTIAASARLNPSRTHFFPDENGYWDSAKARVVSQRPLRLASPLAGQPDKRITGVISDGLSAYRLRFERAARR